MASCLTHHPPHVCFSLSDLRKLFGACKSSSASNKKGIRIKQNDKNARPKHRTIRPKPVAKTETCQIIQPSDLPQNGSSWPLSSIRFSQMKKNKYISPKKYPKITNKKGNK
jgi:hypothetical protein